MSNIISYFLYDYTVRLVLTSSIMLSCITSILGIFIVLRRQSLLVDTLAHASLPGLVLAFFITHVQHPIVRMLCAAISGTIGMGLMHTIEQKTTLKKDTILGIILSVFFGFGMILMSMIQRSSITNKAILHKILFGNIATILPADVYTLACVALFAALCYALWWKDFVILMFDYPYAQSIGYACYFLEAVLTSLLIMTVVIGIQIVGIMLLCSMIIAPAVAAYQWCNHIRTMTFFALCCGIASSSIGATLSCAFPTIPTGPAIVLVLNSCVAISLAFGKKRNNNAYPVNER